MTTSRASSGRGSAILLCLRRAQADSSPPPVRTAASGVVAAPATTLRQGPHGQSSSVRKAHDKSQRHVEAHDLCFVKAANRPRNARSSHGHWLVGHDLRPHSQTIPITRIDGDAKVGGVGNLRCHLTNDHGGRCLGKGICLNDNRGARLPAIPRRRDDNHITSSHRPPVARAHRTRKPPRSSSGRPPPRPERDGRPDPQHDDG